MAKRQRPLASTTTSFRCHAATQGDFFAKPLGLRQPAMDMTLEARREGADPKWSGGWSIGCIACMAIITFFFALRWLAKWYTRLPLKAEDWMYTASWVFSMVEGAANLMMVQYGLGRHVWELSPGQNRQLLKWTYISSLLYGPAVLTTKMTLLLIMARVFSVQKGVTMTIRALMGCMILFYLILELVKALVCLPVAAAWDPRIRNARCINQRKIFVADSSFAIATDTTIFLLPIIICFSLRLSWKRRIRILSILGAGGGAVAIAIYKTYLLTRYESSDDYSHDFAKQVFFSYVEITIGQACACLPIMTCGVRKALKKHKEARADRARRTGRTGESSTLLASLRPSKAKALFQSKSTKGTRSTLISEPAFEVPEIVLHDAGQLLGDIDTEAQYLNNTESDQSNPPLGPATSGRVEQRPMLGAMLNLQHTRTPSEILVPDRIWDGVTRDAMPP